MSLRVLGIATAAKPVGVAKICVDQLRWVFSSDSGAFSENVVTLVSGPKRVSLSEIEWRYRDSKPENGFFA
jgi:hypothetical protein